ncbi:hypothetical protein DITRI_Ditri02bG0158400 [Diplodiscus trichospermus]
MAESLVAIVLDRLLSITGQQAAQAFKLVTGVEEEVHNLTSNLQAIKAVLEDAEKRQVNESAVKHWLDQLKDASYDIDDVLDEWNTEILKREIEQEGTGVTDVPLPKKVLSFTPSSCFCFRQVVLRHGTALKIEELNKRLDFIADQISRYNFTSEVRASHEQRNITTSLIDESEVFVREEDKKRIKDMLLCDSSEEIHSLRVISVVGMGGIGKTTLTRLAFNDDEVKCHFEKRIWVCVSDPFEEERIAVEILECLLGRKPDLVGKDNIMREIRERVSRKKILLVLDDVWTEDPSKWEQLKGSLKNSSSGSRILITTRNEKVGKVMGSKKIDMFSLGTLSEEKCWSLFCHLAFFDRPKEECESLEGIGRKIVEKCKGLPLAVKTVAGLLCHKTKEHWQSILDSKMWEIEEVEKGVFPPLLLSYYDLPPVLRQCFSYCAIFPKDFEIGKDKLIKLWMAQGFLKETGNKGMEIIGEEYFNKLAMCSFFQDFEKDENNLIIGCKMHDIVHDFAQFLTEKECTSIEIDGVKEPWRNASFKTIRHSTLIFEKEPTFPIPVDNWTKLRSLLFGTKVKYYSANKENLLKSVDQFTCLRALDLCGDYFPQDIRMLPNEIGKLIHLRYLNLSSNRELKILPEAICDLYNLQTLDISDCIYLTRLPRGIGKLINLMHLENERTRGLSFLPKGMEKLTRLQTLKEFTVGNLESCCSLGYLGKLNHPQGYLRINGLQKVDDASDAREARLSAKTGLRRLSLCFGYAEGKPRKENQASVLEALQPHTNLETLEISDLEGPTLFPNWMMSLVMLKTVRLTFCEKWESLPPMGKLPALENLNISSMSEVRNVGEEFLGIERDLAQASSSSSSSSITKNNFAFPNLTSLSFSFMNKWEEWEYGNLFTRQGGQDPSCITIMPCLRSLCIEGCPKLKSLPHHLLQNTAIQDLCIMDSPILEERFKKEVGGGLALHLSHS